MRTLDLAIVGCGTVVEMLYRGALRKLESRGIARVAALVDPNQGRTATLQRVFRSARAFATPAEAFARMRPDLVIVASPPGRHAEHAIEALAAGSHVLCEKPIATSVTDAERMVAAARAADRILAVGMLRRLYPCLSEAQALLSGGVCGDELRFSYREGSVVKWPVSTDAAFHRATGGGGVLTDFGSHVLDFLAALFGAPTVRSYADDALGDGVETNCRIELAFPGAIGSVQLSWNQPLVTSLSVTGSTGELVLDPSRPDSLRWRRHGGAWQAPPAVPSWPCDLRPGGPRARPRTQYDCVYHQIVLALRAAVRDEPVLATGDQALATVRAIDACYQRVTALPLPWLSPGEQEAAEARHWSRRRCAAT